MYKVAIFGAGDLGGALARALATAGVVGRVTLIDDAHQVAAGKALDIRQSGPIEASDTIVDAAADVDGADAADMLVLADRFGHGEWNGDAALQLVSRLAVQCEAPIICAGAGQHEVMALAVDELQVAVHRLIGSAPTAASAIARTLAADAAGVSPTDVLVPVLGLPPGWVLAWGQATAAGAPLDGMAPHVAARIEQALAGAWPAGPYSLASAAAAVVHAALMASRRRLSCFVAAPFGGVRPVVFAQQVRLAPGGVAAVTIPDLTPRQRVTLEATVLARR
jgi:malate/lactate dehydrogenase